MTSWPLKSPPRPCGLQPKRINCWTCYAKSRDRRAWLNLDPRHLAEVRAIVARRVPHSTVLAFGSRVTGGARPWSDLDLTVYGAYKMTLRDLTLLRLACEESTLPMRVDVCDGHRLNSELDGHVRATGELYRIAMTRGHLRSLFLLAQ